MSRRGWKLLWCPLLADTVWVDGATRSESQKIWLRGPGEGLGNGWTSLVNWPVGRRGWPLFIEAIGCIACESLGRKLVNCFFCCFAMLALLPPRTLFTSGAYPLWGLSPDVPHTWRSGGDAPHIWSSEGFNKYAHLGLVELVESGKKFPGLACQKMGTVILGEAWQVVSDLWGFSFPGRLEGPVLFGSAVPVLYTDSNLLS